MGDYLHTISSLFLGGNSLKYVKIYLPCSGDTWLNWASLIFKLYIEELIRSHIESR